MIPDPEREQAMQARLSRLFADTPDPDPVRLAAALDVARSRRARRRRMRRTLGWLAAACLFAAGTATAWWLADSGRDQTAPAGSTESGTREKGVPAESSREAQSESSAQGADEPNGRDSRVIYQRAN